MSVEDIQQEVFESLEIDGGLLPVANSEEDKMQAFRQLLITRIEELAEKDMEKLLWILYRIDVSEKKLQQVLKQTAPENFAAAIADLIIERQIQKAESRKSFRNKQGDWSFDV